MTNLQIDEIAAAHFNGEGDSVVSINMNDYREFISNYRIIRSSHLVVEKGDLQSVIPRVREAFAGSMPSSAFFISIRIKKGDICKYEDIINLLHATQPNTPSASTDIQWGVTEDTQMKEDVRVFILEGVKKEA